jgi:predicted nucleotidyltransferase
VTPVAAYPPQVAALLDDLLAGLRSALDDSLLGLYLGGSLALGAFDPKTSDVDVLVVTHASVTDSEFAALDALHRRLPPIGNRFSVEYEVYYIDKPSLRRYRPGQPLVRVEPGFGLYRTEERPNWVLERWTVRERGIVLLGPDPKTLIDPVSPQEIREAAVGELRQRLQNWRDGTWPRSELLHRGAQSYEVETACRALSTHETGTLSSKGEAAAWALENLPERWRPLIEWAHKHRKDRTPDETRIDEVMRFLSWATKKAKVEL